jgi:predicted flavoprotein YhiN
MEALTQRLSRPRDGQSMANFLRKAANLSPLEINLLREVGGLAADPGDLSRAIKSVTLPVTGLQGLGRAISTAGGIARSAVDEGLQLRALPGVYAVGEMLDWEAPTGGYLLQGCFSTAVWAARSILAR